MQKESSLFFSFPSAKDSKLVSLGSSKKFGEAKVTEKREGVGVTSVLPPVLSALYTSAFDAYDGTKKGKFCM